MKSSTRILSLLLVLTMLLGIFSMSVFAAGNETEMDPGDNNTTERDPAEGEDGNEPGDNTGNEGETGGNTGSGDNETEIDPNPNPNPNPNPGEGDEDEDEDEDEDKPGKPAAPKVGKIFDSAIYLDCTNSSAHDRYRSWEVTKKYTPVWNDFNDVWEIRVTVANIGDYVPGYIYNKTCNDRYCTDRYCTVHNSCNDRYCDDRYCTVHNTCNDRYCDDRYCTGYHGELDFIFDSVNDLYYCAHYDRVHNDTCNCGYDNYYGYSYYGHRIIRKDATIVLRWSETRDQWYVYERAYVRMTCDGVSNGVCNSKHTHTIKFTDGVSGKVIFKDKVYSVKHNGKVPAVKDPVREGYRFAGWSPKFTEKATKCVTYVAQWVSGDAPALTTEHVAYMKGYGKGYVRPEAKVTRAEMATILYRLLDTASVRSYYTSANSFSDVNGGDWYNDAVSTLVNAGIIKGYAGGKYYPNAYITRAELTAMLARFEYGTKTYKANFNDVSSSHWAYDEIAMAQELGWIKGYGGSTFTPDGNVTRAEVAAILNRMLDRGDCKVKDTKNYVDNPTNAWFYNDILEASIAH